ncbi:hypothetical protein DFH09DRAFT_1315082 [Mycena vulgaris]|nr:hypothetical protein DFH09DRAFT_1315082 [Mycena vulgaris]
MPRQFKGGSARKRVPNVFKSDGLGKERTRRRVGSRRRGYRNAPRIACDCGASADGAPWTSAASCKSTARRKSATCCNCGALCNFAAPAYPAALCNSGALCNGAAPGYAATLGAAPAAARVIAVAAAFTFTARAP